MSDAPATPIPTWARRARTAAFLCFAVFVVNVVAGKVSLLLEWGLAAPLDGPLEFLLLLTSVTLFVIYALAMEKQQMREKPPENNDSEESG